MPPTIRGYPRRSSLFLLALVSVGCANAPAAAPAPTKDRPGIAPPIAPESPPMPKLPPIVQTGDLVLRARAEEVPAEKIREKEFRDLVSTMITVMRKAPGVGLAAPQIGVGLRVIVLEDREELIRKISDDERQERKREAFPTRVFVNPILTRIGDEKATFFEGCLSVHGYVALVERHLEVEVTGLDEEGVAQTWRVRGWPARILQHEVDHLDGTLYIDRMRSRSFSTQEHAKALYGGKPIGEVLRIVP
jgi:peptide deformylase